MTRGTNTTASTTSFVTPAYQQRPKAPGPRSGCQAARRGGWVKGGPGLRGGWGGASQPFGVHALGLGAFSVDGVHKLEELGVTDVRVGFRYPYVVEPDTQPLQEKIDLLNRFSDSVMAKV